VRTAYAQAVEGRTGIAAFDTFACDLVRHGYLHNHARMWFASIWIFTLKLDWELGADFFLRHLRDGDAASNTLSWRWVAGLHTKGKTYLARADNIARFTAHRPDGPLTAEGLAEEAEPLTEDREHGRRTLDLPGPAAPEALAMR
jgi:deoxyribodipyrimidine photo-lyase